MGPNRRNPDAARFRLRTAPEAQLQPSNPAAHGQEGLQLSSEMAEPPCRVADRAGPDDSGRVISPAPEWEYDQAGTGSMAARGYVPEKPTTQYDGTGA